MYFYTILLRGFRKRGHWLFLYNRWLFNATSSYDRFHCVYCMCTCCVLFTICSVQYPDLTEFLQCIQIVIFISILEKIVQEEKKKKEKERYSPPQPCSLRFLHQRGIQSTLHIVFSFIVRCCDTLFVGILVTTPWMCVCVCKFMEVILCKLLPQFFLEKITSINENIFSFFYKRCKCLAFSHFIQEACQVNFIHIAQNHNFAWFR